ncbi:hypothetical protein QYM36_002280 [Artemia franciscana]|uniref:Ubiquitin-like protease family profile domain-containing protein n=1 Tax=Artemia franciscana TaxID=6661 RepID=A0AA88LJ94_ARTSF|nr:hypothetical protein QYM36_002280 [Artemia franciscana]
MTGKKRGKEARGKKFVNKYKEIQEKIKVQRSNQEYSREYEYEMVSTICESTEEGGQQGDEINEDGFQTHFEAKVLEKINIEGNFENDKLGMKFKECMEIKECKDMEKVDTQESMLKYFKLEEENEFQVNHGTSLRNPVDPHLNETKKYSSLSKKVQNFQKDRPSIIQETRGTSLCNPVDLNVYETKKSALKSTEAAIILKTAPETAISRFKLCKNTISSYPAAALTFRHPDFDHKGTTPTIPIAFLLHKNRSADSHEELFMVLMKKAPSINSPQNAFVSDREKGIEAARKKIFPLIQPAHCWLYYRINAKHALQKMGAPKGDIRVIEDDILLLLRSKNIDEYNQIRTERLVKWSIPALSYFQVNLESDMLKYDYLESLLRPETWLKTEMVSYLVNLVTSSCVSARTIDIYSTFNLTNIDALKSYPEKPRERFSDVSHDCSVLFVPLCVNMRDISDRERKNHFILGICDFSRRTFYLLDSLKPLNRTQGRQVLSNLKYLMDGVDKRYTELELGSCGIAPQVDSSSCGLFVVKYAQDYANGITYLGSALSVDLPSPSKYKRQREDPQYPIRKS